MKSKKLEIKKVTISNLEQAMQSSVKGGSIYTATLPVLGFPCTSKDVVETCPTIEPPGRELF